MRNASLDVIFAPRLGAYLGRLEQKPFQKILTDPISLCNALLRAQKLFQLDALCIEVNAAWIGQSILSPPDELMQQGLIRSLLDALKSLESALPRGVGIIGIIPGPCSLSQQLESQASTGEAVSFEWCLELAMMLGRHYGELDALKAVLITERWNDQDKKKMEGLSRLSPLLNLLSFYQLTTLLALTANQDHSQDLSSIADLGFQGVIIGDPFEPVRPPPQNFVLGWAVSPKLLTGEGDVLTRRLQEVIGQGISLLTTQGEVPFDTDPAMLHLISKFCKDYDIRENA